MNINLDLSNTTDYDILTAFQDEIVGNESEDISMIFKPYIQKGLSYEKEAYHSSHILSSLFRMQLIMP